MPTWNVCCADINTGEIKTFNIFDHSSFWKSCQESYQKSGDKTVFAKKIQSELRYWFWSKFEWEIEVGCLFKDIKRKVDVAAQVELNWDRFVDYLWDWYAHTMRYYSEERGISDALYISDEWERMK